ncbi:hypothetical protein GALMADRAFT_87717 [Galerina marginata CBS 339.88]|uniref:Ribosomal L1 domain-containing protein 1 n=1 Tax=Galerina marginata (strain CBS 339.88) TaxID=685588 RepID=A0A067TJC0_GALM3|nr:hypothetical protein GALMADRAFT_87717 [Galerina marginata CBS 339.88]
MAKEELIDSHVSLKQCQKAVEALHTHELKKKEKFEENQLLPAKEQNIWLNVTVKTVASGHKLKPVKIPIVHPLVDPRTSSVCLITKDPQREYKDLLERHNIKFISRVVGIEKLKGKFKPFEARRMLLKENGLFLADERVVPLLPKLLGSKWFEAKKQPIPVCLTRKDLKGELERAISSTYMNQNQGTCTSIKAGKMSQTPAQILDNIKTALPAVAKAIKGGWDNIQSFNIKTNSSASLPIWSCSLDDAEGGRWHGLQAESEEEDENIDADGISEEDVEDEDSKKAPISKGRKRTSSSNEDEEEAGQPKKKTKAADGSSTTKDKIPSTQKSGKLASANIDAPTKKRKVSEALATPEKPAASTSAGKKPQKSKSVAATEPTVAPASETTTPKPESVAGSGKKKKAQSSAPPPTSTGAPTSGAPTKKKTTKLDSPSVTPSEAVEPSPHVTESAKPSSTKDKSGRDKKKTTEVPAVQPALSGQSVKPTLTQNELKQKRTAGHGEKKKNIVVKSKGGKSAKNAVLGRKVAQE